MKKIKKIEMLLSKSILTETDAEEIGHRIKGEILKRFSNKRHKNAGKRFTPP